MAAMNSPQVPALPAVVTPTFVAAPDAATTAAVTTAAATAAPTRPVPRETAPPRRHAGLRGAVALGIWALAWALMVWADGQLDLANLAMVLVLASALSALWWPGWLAMLVSLGAVAAFNWNFVPPRGSFTVDLHQHALLLAAMVAVSWIVAGLVLRQRLLLAQARRHAERAEQLRQLGDALRDTSDPIARAGLLRDMLSALAGPTVLMLLRDALPVHNDAAATVRCGDALADAGRDSAIGPTADGSQAGGLGDITGVDEDTWQGLWLCLRQSRALGRGTARHAELPAWYLPLRGRHGSWGAARVALAPHAPEDSPAHHHAQALCDQMGMALERAHSARAATAGAASAQAATLRNTLLTAIAHDHRTPLATILGAASSLQSQDSRLDAAQRQRLASTIVDQATGLARLVENTLQLARLGAHAASGVQLSTDWESAEELVGSALHRSRQRAPQRALRARLEPDLPLLRCDAIAMAQLLDNLIDNALAYSPAESPVELLVRRQRQAGHDGVLLAVRDRGPGVPPAWRERIFDAFQRGPAAATSDAAAGPPDGTALPAPAQPTVGQVVPRGAGVGLALCRAIAQAHGGSLNLRQRDHGGCSFECWLPVVAQPTPCPPTPDAST